MVISKLFNQILVNFSQTTFNSNVHLIFNIWPFLYNIFLQPL